MEILVYDDLSTDKTADIVKNKAVDDPRIRLIAGIPLPGGWLGKTHACHRLALEAQGDYLLFLDADVRIDGDIIRKTAAMSSEKGLSLVSVFPRQIMHTPGEWSTVPLMHFILLSLLPLILVRKSGFSSLSAANGQFMLFDAQTYQKYLPHEKMKADKVEDISIARWLKKSGHRVACLTGIPEIQCRMYTGYREAVNGFTKNVAAFFGNSLLLAFLFWAITTAGWAVVLYSFGWITEVLFLLVLLFTRILVSLTARQKVILNLLFWIPQQITLGIILLKSVQFKINRKYIWKGRNIQS
jgi:glycosyltransferase involved in cell wall biosynthesis